MPNHISRETNTHEERSDPQKFAALVKSFWSMTLAKSDQTKPKPKNPKNKRNKKRKCAKNWKFEISDVQTTSTMSRGPQETKASPTEVNQYQYQCKYINTRLCKDRVEIAREREREGGRVELELAVNLIQGRH